MRTQRFAASLMPAIGLPPMGSYCLHTSGSQMMRQRDLTPTAARFQSRLDESGFLKTVELTSKTYLTIYERLLRGIAAAESLSGRGCLYHRSGIHHSNWVCGFSGMGIAKLDAASCHRTFAGWFSGRAHPRLGLRRDAARNSSHPKGS